MSAVTAVGSTRLTYADCDPAGIVYYAAWFVAMERVLTEWFLRSGFRFDRMPDELRGGVVTRSTWCEYLAPAQVYDEIVVEMTVAKVGTTSYTLAFEMVRTADAVVVARSGLVGVFVAGGRAAPLPPALRAALVRGGGAA